MESLTIVGGIPSPFLSSSLRTPSSRITNFSCSLIIPNAVVPNHHLAALQPAFHLFSSAPKRHHRPRIFLPHLVASMEEVEQTYIIIKPDGVQRGLPYLLGKLQDILQEGLSSFQSQTFGQSSKGLRISTYGFRLEIISRFERKGFKLTGLKLFQCPKELAEEHYKDLQSKPFFPKLIDYITSGPVVCMGWEGVGVVASARKLIGATNPLNAEPGTIRGDLAVQTGRNVVHGSDSPGNVKREIALWFKEGELCPWAAVQ